MQANRRVKPDDLFMCSECQHKQPMIAFPRSCRDLSMFPVCMRHQDYWIPEKRNTWAPQKPVTLQDLKVQVLRRAQRERGAQETWVLHNAEGYNDLFIALAVSEACGWPLKKVRRRNMRSRGNEPEMRFWDLCAPDRKTRIAGPRVSVAFSEEINQWAVALHNMDSCAPPIIGLPMKNLMKSNRPANKSIKTAPYPTSIQNFGSANGISKLPLQSPVESIEVEESTENATVRMLAELLYQQRTQPLHDTQPRPTKRARTDSIEVAPGNRKQPKRVCLTTRPFDTPSLSIAKPEKRPPKRAVLFTQPLGSAATSPAFIDTPPTIDASPEKERIVPISLQELLASPYLPSPTNQNPRSHNVIYVDDEDDLVSEDDDEISDEIHEKYGDFSESVASPEIPEVQEYSSDEDDGYRSDANGSEDNWLAGFVEHQLGNRGD